MPTISHRVALLIDAENADPKQFKAVIEPIALLGRTMIRRAYGNPAALKKWEKILTDYHVVPIQTPGSANKPNASDIALTIDAVGLLHDGRYDHLCIVTSDADFTLLAIHVREQGKLITGFGESKTPELFRSALDEFIELAGTAIAKVTPETPGSTAKKKVPSVSRIVRPTIDKDKLREIYREASARSKNGVTLEQIGNLLSHHGVERRGHGTLTKYLRESGLFSVKDKRVTLD
jgi:hypothetical protein